VVKVLIKRIGTSTPETTNKPTPTTTPPDSSNQPRPSQDGGNYNSRLSKANPVDTVQQRDKQEKVLYELKTKIQDRLIADMERKRIPASDESRVKSITEDIFQEVLSEDTTVTLTKTERAQLLESILAEIMGLGPLTILMKDDTITEVMINGPRLVWVEQKGKLIRRYDCNFQDNYHLMRIIERIVAPLGRRIDESSPMVDARLPDGSRVNIVIPPIALKGPTITIRKFSKKPLTVEDLIKFGSLNRQIAEFMRACVIARLNIVVSGGTGSGKTTLLNVLSGFIPEDERIVTVENAAELQLRQEHVVTLESRPSNIEGKGEISIRDLVINCLRMRPDRVVVGECRGGETLDMLQAMNTGHDGSLTTAHSNGPKDTISRMETMCLMAGMDLPIRAIREQIASAVHLIVHQARMQDGSRKVVSIAEVDGMEGDIVKLQEIFRFEQSGMDENGKVIGSVKPTGVRPRFEEKFEEHNIYLPPDTFGSAGQLRAF
jgi:pilus assembly protein CpaF